MVDLGYYYNTTSFITAIAELGMSIVADVPAGSRTVSFNNSLRVSMKGQPAGTLCERIKTALEPLLPLKGGFVADVGEAAGLLEIDQVTQPISDFLDTNALRWAAFIIEAASRVRMAMPAKYNGVHYRASKEAELTWGKANHFSHDKLAHALKELGFDPFVPLFVASGIPASELQGFGEFKVITVHDTMASPPKGVESFGPVNQVTSKSSHALLIA